MVKKCHRHSKLEGALVITGLILLLPLIMPVAIVSDFVYRRRMLKAAIAFRCENCGTILGKKSLSLANEAWSKKMAETRARYPGVRLRIVRDLHAICPACATQYRYFERDRVFKAVSNEK